MNLTGSRHLEVGEEITSTNGAAIKGPFNFSEMVNFHFNKPNNVKGENERYLDHGAGFLSL